MPTISKTLLFFYLVAGATMTAAQVKVVTTLPSYASIAKSVGGDRVEVQAISRGDEDAHFVKPKPSFALMLRDADLFVTTGLDLELWAPTLVDKSGNRRIRDGQPGFVSASQNVPLLDIPAVADRSAGDVHVYGNPHIFTGPLNAKIIGANIAAGLTRVDPEGAAEYEANLAAFSHQIDQRLFGKELVAILGGERLDRLVRQGELMAFLESQTLQGVPLIHKLAGWLGKSQGFRGEKIVTYHKNWIYLTDLLGLQVVGYVEPKPGIPPSARHVHELVEKIKRDRIQVLLAASYFSARQVQSIAERTGCRALRVPMGPGVDGTADLFALIDLWIDKLARAFASGGVSR
jgi:ABC-type Zn uptake system ZnuABC Zn-binding protein ZnuA